MLEEHQRQLQYRSALWRSFPGLEHDFSNCFCAGLVCFSSPVGLTSLSQPAMSPSMSSTAQAGGVPLPPSSHLVGVLSVAGR